MSLHLRTLGRLEITWKGNAPETLTLRKSQALLIYLALEPGPHDRSHLAGLLWGDLPESNARRNLRHALHKLRQALDPGLLDCDRLSVGLNSEVPHRVDALEFERALEQAEGYHRAGEANAAVERREAAAALYRGDFLVGFDVGDCLEFETWSARYRAHLRVRFLDTLDALVSHWTRRGAYERALVHARRQLAAEPLWESSHRQMMTLLALTGQRSAALAQYGACRRVLTEELGLEPLEETTDLYEAIRRSALTPSDRDKRQVGAPTFADLPFTGREEEQATLVSWWEGAGHEPGHLALVEGEAGVGKTRLLEEVLRYAETQGATVLRGRCYEFGGGVPYQPIAEALRAHLDDGPPALPPAWLGELSRLLPELREVLPGRAGPRRGDGETARQRLFEAVSRFLLAAHEDHPSLCLFLDDLHWADQSTLDLLHYLVRHLVDAPIWLVGAYRPEEVTLSHPLTRLRQGLSRDHRVARLILPPLSGEAVGSLAQALVGEGDGANLGEFLYHESEGNAFILVEMVNALQEEGAIVARDAPGSPAWNWTGGPSTGRLPQSVQDVVLQRVGRLSQGAQRLLTLAAVLGQPFDVALLKVAARGAAPHVEGYLDEWLSRRLVHPRQSACGTQPPASGVQYDFSHDKIRAALYQPLDGGQRRRLHRRVGEALEERFAPRIEEQVALLAYHWEEAGEPKRAADYLVRAGDQARMAYAHREATDYYRRALAMLESLGQGGREEQARTLMKLGLAHHYAFDYEEARRAHQAGFELWQQVGNEGRAAPSPPAPHPLRLRWLEPTTLDPAMSPDSHTSALLTQLFSGLVTLNPEMSIVPDVAYAWEVSEGGRRYLFHLRDDVRWSDGVPVTARDFEYAWKRALDPTTRSPSASHLHVVRGAKAFHRGEGSREGVGVRAADETTLVVELEEPTGYFLQLLVRPDYYPVPRHVVELHGVTWTEPAHYVTNGSFHLEGWQPGERLILTRNPEYHGRWGGNVEQVLLHPVTDWSERLRMYEEDAVDVLGIAFCPPDERQAACERHAGEHVTFPILESCYLVFDVSRPPFNDARVRRAFAHATDRKALAEGALMGHAAPADGGLIPHGMPGHSPAVGLPYDPNSAQRLLAEAGYPGGRGFPGVDALAFDAAQPRTEHLRARWEEELGVQVAWQAPKWTSFVKQLGEPHHLVYIMWVADYPDPDNFLRVSRAEIWPGWRHDRYEELVREAGRALDQGTRMGLYRQADEILVREAPLLPLTYEREHLLIKPWVRHYPVAANRGIFWKDVILEAHEEGPR